MLTWPNFLFAGSCELTCIKILVFSQLFTWTHFEKFSIALNVEESTTYVRTHLIILSLSLLPSNISLQFLVLRVIRACGIIELLFITCNNGTWIPPHEFYCFFLCDLIKGLTSTHWRQWHEQLLLILFGNGSIKSNSHCAKGHDKDIVVSFSDGWVG